MDKAAKFIELLLNQEKLSYKVVHGKDSITFDGLSIGEGAMIVLIQQSIYLIVKLKRENEIRTMETLCKSFERRFTLVRYSFLKNGSDVTLRLKLPIAKKEDFKTILFEIDSKLQREISPFTSDTVTDKPNSYFVKQYKLWKSISPSEQSSMLEDILVLKERYFRTTKTGKGIINKLNKVKRNLSFTLKGDGNGKTKHLVTGSFSNIYYEFYLIDFAALFRAIELELMKLKVEDFFNGYRIRRNK